jgi:hypothetical protein
LIINYPSYQKKENYHLLLIEHLLNQRKINHKRENTLLKNEEEILIKEIYRHRSKYEKSVTNQSYNRLVTD